MSKRENDEASRPFLTSVVHPTDFSAASERAFAHALAIALLRRAKLILLHVTTDAAQMDWSEFPAVRGTLERWGLLKPGSTQKAVFDELGVRVTKRVISSRFPAASVVSYLDDSPADLLVVATEGREGASRWLHGSVAEAMARRSRTMTLFVPEDLERSIVSGADGSLTLRQVLIPVDHAPDPGAAIEFAVRAAELAADGGVKITLLHVGAKAEMPTVQARDGDGWTFERLCRAGDPVAEILAAADLVHADLIVMPTQGRAGVFDALHGSTTERVLRGAHCPLLAVPAGRYG
jgi:nucleotide-binding universal stress UspA family protein